MNAGGDADTNAAVACSVLGAKYGFEISSASVYIGPSDSDITTEREKFTKLTSSIDGEYYIYTTPKIIEDSKIIMNVLERKEYSVGFEGQFVIFKTVDDSELEHEQKIKHGDPYSFKLYPEEGYNLNQINVYTNTGSKITLKESTNEYNLYNIESVRENLVVIVSGSRISVPLQLQWIAMARACTSR